MKLASLLNPSLIFFHLNGGGREELYTNLLSRMAKEVRLPGAPAEIARGMIEREDAFGIVYEGGFSFPHIRHPQLTDLDIGIGILDKPILLKPNDKTPTRIIICCMISETTSVIYLKALAAFSKFILHDPVAVEKLADSGTSDAFLSILNANKVEVKHSLCAEDIMLRELKTLKPDDPVSKALDMLSAESQEEIPVLDENGKLIGIVSGECIIRRAIPEYIMRLENLNFLSQFEPFETLLKEEGKLHIHDVMTKPEHVIPPEMPLIQLTIRLIKNSQPSLFVADHENRLLGIITVSELVHNVLRG